MAITVNIEELGEGQDCTVKRTKSYITDKQLEVGGENSKHMPSNKDSLLNLLDVKNIVTNRSKLSDASMDLPTNSGVIQASFH